MEYPHQQVDLRNFSIGNYEPNHYIGKHFL